MSTKTYHRRTIRRGIVTTRRTPAWKRKLTYFKKYGWDLLGWIGLFTVLVAMFLLVVGR